MNEVEDYYQSPAVQAPPADTTRLTKQEWRFAGKLFVLATLGAAVIYGAWSAAQTIDMLPSSKTNPVVGGFMALSDMRPFGSVVTLFGVCVALILVVRRRAKAGVPPPKSGLFWPMLPHVARFSRMRPLRQWRRG